MIEFHPTAKKELIEALNYYETQQKGLGRIFLENIELGLTDLNKNPLIWHANSFGRRKYRVFKFPYL